MKGSSDAPKGDATHRLRTAGLNTEDRAGGELSG